MKKLSFFWILALVICSVISCAEKEQFEQELQTQKREQFKEKLSHEVTQTEALENLEKFLLGKKLPSTRGGDANQLPPITSVYTRGKASATTRAGEAVEPYFHIFNFGDEEGFAIMSGDDRVEPLLALTFKGELTPETEIDNPGFEYAYKKMEEYYVQQVSSRGWGPGYIEIPPKVPLPDPRTGRDTIHLPCPQWGQRSPYNKYCYTDDDSLAVTGCVATAVAQLMAIHKYPDSYNGYEFNWDLMTSDNPDSVGYDQIARLMEQLGTDFNLRVNYGTKVSTASSALIPRTFENFGYSNGGWPEDYNTSRIMQELRAGYPVLVGGSDTRLGDHRWLAHGLIADSISIPIEHPLGEITWLPAIYTCYIFCNWGWDGQHDGYFLSNVFDIIDPDTGDTIANFNPTPMFLNIRK